MSPTNSTGNIALKFQSNVVHCNNRSPNLTLVLLAFRHRLYTPSGLPDISVLGPVIISICSAQARQKSRASCLCKHDTGRRRAGLPLVVTCWAWSGGLVGVGGDGLEGGVSEHVAHMNHKPLAEISTHQTMVHTKMRAYLCNACNYIL